MKKNGGHRKEEGENCDHRQEELVYGE